MGSRPPDFFEEHLRRDECYYLLVLNTQPGLERTGWESKPCVCR